MEAVLSGIAAGTTATVALLENADWGDTRISCTLGADGVLQGSKKFVADATAAGLLVVVVEHEGAPALAIVRAEQLAAGAIVRQYPDRPDQAQRHRRFQRRCGGE